MINFCFIGSYWCMVFSRVLFLHMIFMDILLSFQEKKALKEEKMKQEEKYMWAVVDGVKEKVSPDLGLDIWMLTALYFISHAISRAFLTILLHKMLYNLCGAKESAFLL